MFKSLVLWILIEAFSSKKNATIYGNTSLGYYYVEASVGSQGQKQSLIIDTGSHVTIFTCEGCTKCANHLYGSYKLSNSTSFQKLNKTQSYFGWHCLMYGANDTCNFFQGYVEGSQYQGYYAQDVVSLSDEPISKDKHSDSLHVFGCANVETGEFFYQKVDGIMGFGGRAFPRGVPNSEPPSFLQLEYLEGRIKENSFSMCLGHNGGSLTVGGWNNALHLPHSHKYIIECPGMKWEDQYFLNLTNIAVN